MLVRVPRDPGRRRPASTTARASSAGDGVHPDLHAHPHQRAAVGPRPTTRELGRQRRHVRVGHVGRACRWASRLTFAVAVHPTAVRRSTRRSCTSTTPANPGVECADDEHGRRGGRSSPRPTATRVSKSGTVYRNQVGAATSSASRRLRRRSRSTCRVVALRAGAGQIRFLRFHPYGVGLENNSSTELVQPTGSGLRRELHARPRRPAGPPRTRRRACGRSTVEVRRTSDAVAVPYSLTMSILGATVTPNPDIDRVGHPRRSGCPVLHRDQPVRWVHRPDGRLDARERHDQHGHDREHRSASSTPSTVTAGNDVASRDDREPVRPGRRPRPVRLQLHAAVVP